MKLELKHLAPYLPYKLRIKYQERNQVMNLGKGHSVHWIGIRSVLKWQNVNGEPPKPILYPLSYLTDEVLIEFNFINRPKSGIDLDSYSYGFITYCFENHINIFGLIDKGLAVDKTTLNQ